MNIHMSENVAELISALVKAVPNFHPIVKNRVNPHFKNSYADLESIREAITPALTGQGLVVVQTTVPVGDSGHFDLVTTLYHTTGQFLRGVYPIRPTKLDPAQAGSALTYARRYTLQSILSIVAETDDDGSIGSGLAPKKTQTPNQPTAKPVHLCLGCKAPLKFFAKEKTWACPNRKDGQVYHNMILE